jgi:hypothetical protein
LQASYRWLVEASPVAGAFEDADDVHDRHPSKVRHGQLEWSSDVAIDRQPPRRDVDARRVDV